MQIVSCNIFPMHRHRRAHLLNDKWANGEDLCANAVVHARRRSSKITRRRLVSFVGYSLFPAAVPCAAVKSTLLQKVNKKKKKKKLSINKSDARNFQCARDLHMEFVRRSPNMFNGHSRSLYQHRSRTHFITEQNAIATTVEWVSRLANERAVRKRKRRRTKSRHLINWWICLLHVINVNHYTALHHRVSANPESLFS